MRYVCYGAAVMVLVAAVVGCETPNSATLEIYSYRLGPKPIAAQKIIDVIITQQLKVHAVGILRDTKSGEKMFMSQVIKEEDVVVVRTTREGHRQINKALEQLRQ